MGLLVVALLGSFAGRSAGEVFGGVDFPQGASSFADVVLEYDPLHSGGPAPTNGLFTDPQVVLGAPDFPDGGDTGDTGAVALGRGGLLSVGFTDNLLTNSGDDGLPDLHVFEVGEDAESFLVAVRPTWETLQLLDPGGDADGDGFFEVGSISAFDASLDLDGVFSGFAAGALVFDAVQLIDDYDQGNTSGATVGADIDAVGAISSVAREFTSSTYVTDLTRADWDDASLAAAAAGLDPVDIEVRWTGTEERFTSIFAPVTGTPWVLIQGTSVQWADFFDQVELLDGRFLDMEVGYFDTEKRYTAIFLEDGDNYTHAVHTTTTEAEFQALLAQYLDAGRALVDFEAYTEPGGDLRLAGLWASDPNQPRTVLHYHLESEDVSDLLRPLAGRLIDFERYWSPLHEEVRYAVITAMYPHGGWAHYRDMTEVELGSLHVAVADADTAITDIEAWGEAPDLRYGALWGDGSKTQLEVPSIPPDTDPKTPSAALETLLTDFESGDQGVIGLWAKNLRTGQTLSWRADEPFYLASSTKVAIHVRFWQHIESGHLDPNQPLAYTNCEDCRDDWFVDDRPFPGFGPSNGDFGMSFALERFDRGMMAVSDNGAASALVDDPDIGLSWDAIDLNEWLSGLSGVGQGWWPVTSIHDVDRTILWQGQVTEHPDETSFFTIPGWAFEPFFRQNRNDVYGDLAAWLGNPPALPDYDRSIGHSRYYAMGLNSATPRAFGRLLDGLWNEDFLDEPTTRFAIERMTAGTPLDDLLPDHLRVWAKGGSKTGASAPLSSTGLIELQGVDSSGGRHDAIALGVFTEENSRTSSVIRNDFMAPIGLEVAKALLADLQSGDSGSFLPTEVHPGDSYQVLAAVENAGGGDSGVGFEVQFYVSEDSVIDPSGDHPIASASVGELGNGGNVAVGAVDTFPPSSQIPPGLYRIGFVIDPAGPGLPYGEVGEFDEEDNTGLLPGVLVVLSADIFSDGFESGDTTSWTATAP